MKMKKMGILIIILVVCVATVLVAWLATVSGSVKVTVAEDSFSVSASNVGAVDVSYDTIKDIDLVDNIDIGTKIDGIDNNSIQAGEWQCSQYDDFDTYYLFAYTDVTTYIVVTTNNKYVIFNCNSADDTEMLYDKLVDNIAEYNS